MQLLSDSQKIGAFLLIFAGFFTLMGILMFMDGGLFSVANLCALPGLSLLVGTQRLMSWMTQPKKLPGFAAFLGGVILVLRGWTYIGFLVEIFGFLNLFGNYYPMAWAFIRTTLLWGWSWTGIGGKED